MQVSGHYGPPQPTNNFNSVDSSQENNFPVYYNAVCSGSGVYDFTTGVLVCDGEGNELTVSHRNLQCFEGINSVNKEGVIECSKSTSIVHKNTRNGKEMKAVCKGKSRTEGARTDCKGRFYVPYEDED